MAVALLGHTIGASSDTVNVASVSYTVPSGSNIYLVFSIDEKGSGTPTWNGVNCTNLANAPSKISLWGIHVGSSSGAGTLAYNKTGYVWSHHSIGAFSGVDATTPTNGANSAQDYGNDSYSGSVTVPTNGMSYGAVSHSTAYGAPTGGNDSTTMLGAQSGTRSHAHGHKSATGNVRFALAGNVTFTSVAVALNPASSTVNRPRVTIILDGVKHASTW